MKLSAFLAVSVPILTMSQMPAMAGNVAVADTGAWLKESIATLKPVTAAPKKVSHAAPTASTLRLRPFMPNRYLPKERDMRQALKAQEAQYDPSAQQEVSSAAQPLSGNVSTFYATPPTPYDQYSMQNGSQSSMASMPQVVRKFKTARKAAGTRAPRMTPGQMPVVPEQLVQSPQIAPLIPEPPTQRGMRTQFPTSMPVPGFSPMAMQQQQMQQQQMQQQQQLQMQQQMQMQQMQQQQSFQQSVPMQLQPPKLTLQQQVQLDRMVEQNQPQFRMNANGEVPGSPFSNQAAMPTPEADAGAGAGSAPFPLNMLPMQALMAGRHKANVAQARFGSWHGNPNLPRSGFQSWLPVRTPTHYEYSRAPMPTSTPKRKLVSKKPAAASHQTVAHSTPQHSMPSHVVRPMLASYPSFTSARGTAY